jgi:hypothetical protein
MGSDVQLRHNPLWKRYEERARVVCGIRQITSAIRTSAEGNEMTLAYFALVNNTASLESVPRASAVLIVDVRSHPMYVDNRDRLTHV